eukprot:s901_g3.t1
MELGWKIRATAAANKSLVPLPRDEARLDPLLGATIRKIFGSQWYYGQVIAIDADVASGERAYHVAYEDGDEEHLSAVEVKHFLAAAAARSARPSEAGRSTRPSAAGTPRPSLAPMPSVRPSRGPARPAPKPSWGRSLGEVKFASVGPTLAAVAIGLVMVLGSTCLTCLASSLYGAGAGDAVSDLRPASLGTHLPPWAQAAPPAEVPAVSAHWPLPSVEDVEELAPPKEAPLPIPPERETASEIVTNDVEIFVKAPQQADDTASALHTSLLNEASYSEHLEPAGGGAEAESVAVQTVADDELAAAAAALVEASGLVVRVAGRAFVRMLEEAWHSLLGGVSATLCSAVGVSGSEPTGEPLASDEAAGSAGAGLESLMTSALVACAGVMTILVSIRPAEDVPTPLRTIPRPEASWPGQVTASPMRPFLGKPSPAHHLPSPHALPPTALLHHQATRQSLHACNTPARAKTTLDQVKVEIPSTPAPEHPASRTSLMSRLGRTPATAAAVPPGDALQRRPPPPPPVSLTVEPAPQQMPLRSHAKTTPQPQPAPLAKEDACARCGSVLPADDNFCRHCGQQRGKRSCQVPAAMPPSGPAAPAGRAKSKQADKSRFRHTKALSKLKEMGYDDSEGVRDVLTKCNGDLNAALREINCPGTRA